MDVVSYLLGKNSSGGGGSSDLDWSALGFDGMPQAIVDGYDYALEIMENWTPAANINNKYYNNNNLVFMPLVDTTTTTDMERTFRQCYSLISIAKIDTSKVKNMYGTFDSCASLKEIPLLDTSSATTMRQMFTGCRALKTIPILNTTLVTNFQQTFYDCLSLTDESLDNILQMCIGATSYTGTKTLAYLGFARYNGFPTNRFEALPHYQDFINAGWTIGY